MSEPGVHCEVCNTATVQRLPHDTNRVEAWQCTACGDFKRWCPECNQGWIRRLRVARTGADLYSCDECEAAWRSVAVITVLGLLVTGPLNGW